LFIIPEDILPRDDDYSVKMKLNDKILSVLSTLLKNLIGTHLLKALILIGGETSYHLLKSINVNKLFIDKGLDVGIVEVFTHDSGLDDVPIILKGGSIGHNATILDIMNYINNEIQERGFAIG
jgi:uncharacterized protein YgbK (DUF1537 family)